MIRRFLLAFFVLFILCGAVYAQEMEYSGSFITQAGAGLPNTHHNKGDFLVGQTSFDSTFKVYIEESMLYINTILLYDALEGQSSNGASAFVSDNNDFALHLKEAYFDWRGEKLALRVGRQISAWGKADDVQIVDILCPQDESSLYSDYQDNRLGIDAVRLSYIGESTQTDFYWIPFFTPSTLPLAEGNPLNDVMFGSFDNAPGSYSDFDRPDRDLSSSEYGARFSAYLPSFDFSLYGFYGWDDMPFYTADMNGKYKRMAMVGADAAIPAGDFVFRLESAFFPQRYIQASEGGTRQRNQIMALGGVDWTPAGGWTITAQYVADIVTGSDSPLDRHTYEHLATLSVEKPFLNETILLSVSFAMDLRYFSTNTELVMEYKLTDSITLSMTGEFYFAGPDKDGEFGSYKDLSCIILKGKYSF
ncbi:MAG: hypothetical protein IJT92_01805 [Spirochaetia bacterium]|nr:hypothetical protein [Spirochaetia bacterium]